MAQTRNTHTTSNVLSTLMKTVKTEKAIDVEKKLSAESKSVKIHKSHTSAGFRGLSTPSPAVAWASGEDSTFVRTVNGGETWECKQVMEEEKLSFRDIKAFDDKTAYMMSAGEGEESRIYKTEDGGNSWQLQLKMTNSADFFNCMAFWNRDHGMVLGDPVDGKFQIYITINGGGTWSPASLSAMPVALEGEGAFAASGSCLTVQGTSDAWFCTGVNTARVFHTSVPTKTL